jgi:hypothetical protein
MERSYKSFFRKAEKIGGLSEKKAELLNKGQLLSSSAVSYPEDLPSSAPSPVANRLAVSDLIYTQNLTTNP